MGRRAVHEGYNLLFGVIACQMEFVNADQIRQASRAIKGHDRLLAEALVEKGWLTEEQRNAVQELLDTELRASAAVVVEGMLGNENGAARTLWDELQTDASSGQAQASNVSDETVTLNAPSSAPKRKAPLSRGASGGPSARDRYQRREMFAEGGLGRIWIVRDETLKRDVALKELHPNAANDDEARDRFLREAMLTGQLEHPDIVPVYELVSEDPPFYTMRFIRGKTLREVIVEYHAHRQAGERAALDRSTLLSAFVRICQATAFAHARGVIHRDLKPSNIILGDYGEVIVLDWGLAMLFGTSDENPGDLAARKTDFGQSTVAPGTVVGTPGYMAPEQAAGLRELGPQADVYGLGAILFEILTGESPHQRLKAKSAADFLRAVVYDQVPPVRSVQPSAPAALEAVCAKALAKDPSQRYPTALALADDVRRWSVGEPTTAYAEPRWQRAVRWATRHRTFSVAVASALFALVVIAGAIFMHLVERNVILTNNEIANLSSQSRVADVNIVDEVLNMGEDIHLLQERVSMYYSTLDSNADLPIEAITHYQTLFRDFLETKPDYRDVGLVLSREDDREVVRLWRTAHAAAVEEDKTLARYPRGESPVIARAKQIAKEGVFLSQVTAAGDPEDPDAQVSLLVRAIAPIFDGQEIVGAMTIEVDLGCDLEALLGPAYQDEGSLAYVVGANGAILLVAGEEVTNHLEFNPSMVLTDLDLEIAQFFANADSQNTLEIRSAAETGNVYVARKIRFDVGHPENYVGLVLGVTRQRMLSSRVFGSRALFTFALVVLAGTVLTAVVVTRGLNRAVANRGD